MQGTAFLFAYRQFRRASGSIRGMQEAEFNVGRACEMLGLTHLAINSYNMCLTMSKLAVESGEDEWPEDYATDAAFALQRLSIANGDIASATSITKAWLVV